MTKESYEDDVRRIEYFRNSSKNKDCDEHGEAKIHYTAPRQCWNRTQYENTIVKVNNEMWEDDLVSKKRMRAKLDDFGDEFYINGLYIDGDGPRGRIKPNYNKYHRVIISVNNIIFVLI